MKDYSGGIRHDYKERKGDHTSVPMPRWPWFLAGLFLPVAGILLVILSTAEDPIVPPAAGPIAAAGATAKVPLSLPQPGIASAMTAEATAAANTELTSTRLTVQSGDSLDRLFRRHELSLSDLAEMVQLSDARNYLVRLRPDDEIEVAHRDGSIVALSREIDQIRVLNIDRADSGFAVNIIERPVEVRAAGAHGVIQSSLFESAQAAGISDNVIMDMAGIFQWDIDFIQDVRNGDEFTVIYNELWRDGTKLQDSSIVAAEFINQGRLYRAASYEDPNGERGYFTPEGRSVRKAFLRAPVDFARISSNFNPNRRHPVLNTIRAHRGVDYAARTGTPIRAAGDGKISFRGVNGGYGNTVILQHGGNITTLYAHMSRFADPRLGARVRQGQIIGFVGQSGLATGPHLHYEYRINGVHRNPRTVPLPPADPVPEAFRSDFETISAGLWHQLDLYRSAQLAAASN
ncbi:MAG: M23 family metallopeptidase [Gammaproteobacteria bacterium]|nr:M23 family metallopeptidase [Gammaproteobacteria bacterium]